MQTDKSEEERTARNAKWREYNQDWRARHPEKWKEIQRKYYEEHREERADYGRAWRAANADKTRAYLERNKERLQEQARARYVANREHIKARNREYGSRPTTKLARRAQLLAKKYGMSVEEYTARGDALGWMCQSCGGPPNGLGLVVDHDHATGQVRGLLCSKCNSALGLLDDTLRKVQSLARYLRRHEKESAQ